MTSNHKPCFVLLPHADDEAFILPELLSIYPKSETYFILLTHHDNHSRRVSETSAALSYAGYNLNNFFDLKVAQDGELLNQLVNAYIKIEERISSITSTQFDLVCPAWEGGHQDHDAAFIVSHKIKSQHLSGCHLRVYWLYNGAITFGRFFSVARPLSPVETGRFSWRVAVRFSVLPFLYRSQLKTWAGLLLGYLNLRLCKRSLNISCELEIQRLAKPHSGALLYERWKRENWSVFKKTANEAWQQSIIE